MAGFSLVWRNHVQFCCSLDREEEKLKVELKVEEKGKWRVVSGGKRMRIASSALHLTGANPWCIGVFFLSHRISLYFLLGFLFLLDDGLFLFLPSFSFSFFFLCFCFVSFWRSARGLDRGLGNRWADCFVVAEISIWERRFVKLFEKISLMKVV